MIKEHGLKNYQLIKNKLIKSNSLDISNVVNSTSRNIICIGSGSSLSTAYFFSKLLNIYYDKKAIYMTPRDLLNSKIGDYETILIFSYSGTSNDTKYIREKYSDSIVITGRNILEFENKTNIYSYYLGEEYEKALILYENVLIPITLLIQNIKELNSIINHEINNFNTYKVTKTIGNNVAIFDGDYTKLGSLDLIDKILETGVIKYDRYEKKDFSHGQYNYFEKNNYSSILYFKQKNVSEYELKLIEKLQKRHNLILIESEYDGIKSEYDLLFKSFRIFNKILEETESVTNYENYKDLYTFRGDFS